MKMLNAKSIFLNLMIVVVLSITIISCNKESIEPIKPIEEQIDNSQMPVGQFSVEVEIFDSKNPSKTVVLSVSTNNEEIFEQLTSSNFKATFLSKSDVETSANQNVEDINKVEEVIDASQFNTDKYFLSIKTISENKGENESIKISLSDELNHVIRKYKAQTHVQISNVGYEDNARYGVSTNAFIAYGDGGTIKTKLRVNYRYTWSSTYYSAVTPNGFLYYYIFKTCQWPNSNSARCMYSGFTVIQDVLTSYTALYNDHTCVTCF